jgi:hypothetical protein
VTEGHGAQCFNVPAAAKTEKKKFSFFSSATVLDYLEDSQRQMDSLIVFVLKYKVPYVLVFPVYCAEARDRPILSRMFLD